MSHERRSVLVDAFSDSALRHRDSATVVCIDVLLATTTLVSAAAAGRRVFVAATPDELAAVAARLEHPVVAGRLEGAGPELDAPDGPCALARLGDGGRPLLLASPPGTELLRHAAAAAPAFVACFRNLSATARALAGERRVALLAAGCREEFGCEDQMAAAWIAERLLREGFVAEDRRTAEIVKRWSGIAPALVGWGNAAAELTREGRAEEVEFVIEHVDDVDRSCICVGHEVRAQEVAARTATAARAVL